MRLLLSAIFLFVFCSKVNGQDESDSFVVVTVEMKTTSRLHPLEYDYWIIPVSMWNDFEEELLPLFIGGFSQTDINECCLLDTLILFNYSTDESFAFKESFVESLEYFRDLIIKERIKVQTVRKKWKGYKEELNIYLTPVSGVFCTCEKKHPDDDSKTGYTGRIAIPSSKLELNSGFKDTKKFKEMKRFDYSALPFISLHTMQ